MMMGLFVPFLGVLLFQQLVMVGGTRNSKLESDLFDDLLSMMSKFKRSELGNNPRKATDIPAFSASSTVSKNYPRKARDIPAFSASSTVTKNLVDGEIVKFDKVWTNNKNCYNPTTGVFTAPKTGLYYVSATVMSTGSKSLYAHLWQNEHRLGAFYAAAGHNEATVNTVLNLKKNDKLYLKARESSGAIYNSKAELYSMFSGYLLSE